MNAHLLSHSFCESRVWEQLREILCVESHKVVIKILARTEFSSGGLFGEGYDSLLI